MSYRLIDLFSGAGGMTLGFVDKRYSGGFKSVWAVDLDDQAVATFNENFGPHAVCEDIDEWVKQGKSVPQADVVIGGPPCQGFSLLNKNREGDARRELWQPFMDVVQLSDAKVFVIENVRELIRSSEYEAIKKRANELGFEVVGDVLLAANYGSPQTRSRAVIIGWKRTLSAEPEFPPEATHVKPGTQSNKPNWKTVEDAIGDLPPPVGTSIREDVDHLDLHFGRQPTPLSVKRYKKVPYGGNRFDLQRNAPELTPQCWIRKTSGGTDLFGRLWWERPSVTIRTEFFKPEKGRYLHPEQDRPITHREAARLMGFPDDFRFKGTKVAIAKQIGNAVPPHLAGAIADVVKQLLAAVTQKAAA